MTTKVDNIINAYANDLEGLTREECLHEDFSAKQCVVLESALGWGTNGIITDEEKNELEQAGFAKDFIQELAGIDGKKALQSRVKWLGDHINTEWYRRDYSLGDRQAMVSDLSLTGPDAKDSVPALIDSLKDEDKIVRFYTAIALGNIGPNAKDSVPALINALKDQNSDVRFYAASALGKIGKDAVPALIDALKDKDYHVRDYATEALGKIGKQAFFAIPILQEMAVNDPDPNCRKTAQWALDKMMGEIR